MLRFKAAALACDPTQLAGLVVGELPGQSEELRLSKPRATIITQGKGPGQELARVRRLVVRRGVARLRQGNDDLAILDIDLKISRTGHACTLQRKGAPTEAGA